MIYQRESSNILSESEKSGQLSLDFSVNQSSMINMNSSEKYSSYIVYVDESGDTNLDGNDKDYPVFVLAFCVFHKAYYARELVPEIQNLKFNYFGHDTVVLHEREIRKKLPPFTFASRLIEENFMQDLSNIIQSSRFVLIASAIMKDKLSMKPTRNAYHIALAACMENLYRFLTEKKQITQTTFIVVESRGNKEDKELELEFRRICDGDNAFKTSFPFEILIRSKQINSTGMQFADLFARPIGRKLIDRGNKENRAFEVLEKKFFCKNKDELGCNYFDYGLTVFPKSEKP